MSSCEIIEGITLHHGDCRDIMRALPADHFDAIITDPPYGTGAMNIRSGMDAAGGSYPPNLMVSDAALAAVAAMEGVNAVGCELDKRYIPLIHERFRLGIDAPLDILI